MPIYLIIGLVVGGIFALAFIFLGIVDPAALGTIMNKNNDQKKLSHATMALLSVIINILIWPIIVILLGTMLFRKYVTPR